MYTDTGELSNYIIKQNKIKLWIKLFLFIFISFTEKKHIGNPDYTADHAGKWEN